MRNDGALTALHGQGGVGTKFIDEDITAAKVLLSSPLDQFNTVGTDYTFLEFSVIYSCNCLEIPFAKPDDEKRRVILGTEVYDNLNSFLSNINYGYAYWTGHVTGRKEVVVFGNEQKELTSIAVTYISAPDAQGNRGWFPTRTAASDTPQTKPFIKVIIHQDGPFGAKKQTPIQKGDSGSGLYFVPPKDEQGKQPAHMLIGLLRGADIGGTTNGRTVYFTPIWDVPIPDQFTLC